MFMIYKNKLTHAWECAIYSLGQFFQHSETKVLFTQLELITLLRTSLVPCGFPGSLSNLGSMLQPPSPPGAPHAKAPLMASMFSLRNPLALLPHFLTLEKDPLLPSRMVSSNNQLKR